MIDPGQVKRQLERICCSPQFRAAGRIRDFLIFVVEQTLAGNEQQIKEYSIATDVYARLPSFDPKLDSIVRVEATKLRARLGEYYARDGSSDKMEIRVPKGGYVAEFYNHGWPLVSGTARDNQISELCDTAFAALMRSTPASLDVAAACFVEARNLDPFDPRPHIGLTNCHGFSLSSETKPPTEVMDELRTSAWRAIRLNENSGDAHVAVSICHFYVDGAAKKAIEEVRRALQLEPQNAVAHLWAPALLSAAGSHEASIAHMRKAIRCAPNLTLFRVYLGRVFYYAGRSAEAIEVLKEVTQSDPALAVGHLWTSLAYTEIEQHDEAIEAARQAVRLSETGATLSAHAYVLARAGRRDEAEYILDRLSTNAPSAYVSPVTLAAIAGALNRNKGSAMYMARARRERAWALLLQQVDPRQQRILSKID